MASKTFINLSNAECLQQYPVVIANGEKHWVTALAMAEHNQNYGLAISTMIISMEELIKAMILFADGNGFDFRKVNGMVSLFRSHQIRYLVMYAGFVMGIFSEELKKFIAGIVKEPEMMLAFSKLVNSDDKQGQKILTTYMHRKLILLRKEYRWFKKLDALRQSGFYSDYNDGLTTPSGISKDDFVHTLERLQKVKNICLGFIDSVTNAPEPQVLQVFDDMRTNLKKEHRYDQIAAWLLKLKKHKYDAFIAFHDAVKL